MAITKRALLAAGAAALALAGCAAGPYYDNGYYGNGSYGNGYYDNGYYGSNYYGAPGYYDPGYAAPGVGFGITYSERNYYRDGDRHWDGRRDWDRRDHDWRDRRGDRHGDRD